MLRNLRFSISFLLTISGYCIVDGHLLNGPLNKTTKIGTTVEFQCQSDLLDDAVLWTVLRPGFSSEKIYHGSGEVVAYLKPRFNVIRDSTAGFQNLTIKNVMLDDAGKYSCVDEMGFGASIGEVRSAELTVIGHPDCHQLRPDNVSVEFDHVNVTCTVIFKGKHIPVLWLRLGETQPPKLVAFNINGSSLKFSEMIVLTEMKGNNISLIVSEDSDNESFSVLWTDTLLTSHFGSAYNQEDLVTSLMNLSSPISETDAAPSTKVWIVAYIVPASLFFILQIILTLLCYWRQKQFRSTAKGSAYNQEDLVTSSINLSSPISETACERSANELHGLRHSMRPTQISQTLPLISQSSLNDAALDKANTGDLLAFKQAPQPSSHVEVIDISTCDYNETEDVSFLVSHGSNYQMDITEAKEHVDALSVDRKNVSDISSSSWHNKIKREDATKKKEGDQELKKSFNKVESGPPNSYSTIPIGAAIVPPSIGPVELPVVAQEYTPDPHKLTEDLYKVTTGGCRVVGVAALKDKLYILCDKQEIIHVLSSLAQQSYKKICEINLKDTGMKAPKDMVAFMNGNCLYVSNVGEGNDRFILKIDVLIAESKPTKWSDNIGPGVLAKPGTLSMTSNDLLLLKTQKTVSKAEFITGYDTSGTRFFTVGCPLDFKIDHFIQCGPCSLMLSYISIDGSSGIGMMDINANRINASRSFEKTTVNKTSLHLATNTVSKIVFVVGLHDHGVIGFNRRLEYLEPACAELRSIHELTRICYIPPQGAEDCGLLLIGAEQCAYICTDSLDDKMY